MFREPEKRPPGIVSNTFTLLVILPLVIFIVMVKKKLNPFFKFAFHLTCLFFIRFRDWESISLPYHFLSALLDSI